MASFDPLPDSVLIWTRLTPGSPAEVVEVGWEVSASQDFAAVSARCVGQAALLCGSMVSLPGCAPPEARVDSPACLSPTSAHLLEGPHSCNRGCSNDSIYTHGSVTAAAAVDESVSF